MIATKLFAPAPRPQSVARSRLADQLGAGLATDRRLTLVSAPAGSGKTTVLGDWVADLGRTQPGTRTSWLSLDVGDNDLTRLLTHVVATLGRADQGLDEAAVLAFLPPAEGGHGRHRVGHPAGRRCRDGSSRRPRHGGDPATPGRPAPG